MWKKQTTMTEYNEEDRFSLILLIREENDVFICNRNSTDFNNLFKDKILKWLEYDNYEMMINDDNMTLLETVDVSNYMLKDQKQLNEIKRKWINNIDEFIEDDDKLCNIAFTEWRKSKRKKANTMMTNILTAFQENTFDDIYDACKNLWFNERWKKIARMKRYEIYEKWFNEANEEQKKKLSLIIVLKAFWMANCTKKMPFTKDDLKYWKKTTKAFINECFSDNKLLPICECEKIYFDIIAKTIEEREKRYGAPANKHYMV